VSSSCGAPCGAAGTPSAAAGASTGADAGTAAAVGASSATDTSTSGGLGAARSLGPAEAWSGRDVRRCATRLRTSSKRRPAGAGDLLMGVASAANGESAPISPAGVAGVELNACHLGCSPTWGCDLLRALGGLPCAPWPAAGGTGRRGGFTRSAPASWAPLCAFGEPGRGCSCAGASTLPDPPGSSGVPVCERSFFLAMMPGALCLNEGTQVSRRCFRPMLNTRQHTPDPLPHAGWSAPAPPPRVRGFEKPEGGPSRTENVRGTAHQRNAPRHAGQGKRRTACCFGRCVGAWRWRRAARAARERSKRWSLLS